MTCVDWRVALRRASFRGVPYYFEADEATYGRRLVVHQFPNRDRPFVEDMGEEAQKFHHTAYVAGDASLAEKAALVAACRRRGPGTLMLADGPVQVRVKSCKRSIQKDQMGYIAFAIEYVEAGAGMGAFPIGLLEALAGASAVTAIAAIIGAFASSFSTRRADSWVVAAALSSVGGIVAQIDTARRLVPMGGEANADLYQRLVAIGRDAAVLVDDGPTPVDVRQMVMASVAPASSGALGQRLADALVALREGGTSEAATAEAFWLLSDYGLPLSASRSVGASETRLADNEVAMSGLVRRLVFSQLAAASAMADWPDRPTAVRWRARVSEVGAREISLAPSELRPVLADLRGKAVEAISRKVADLEPVVTIEAGVSAPSVVWAYRLYAAASRARELVTRNGVRHPSWMPTRFEAVAASANGALSADERRAGL